MKKVLLLLILLMAGSLNAKPVTVTGVVMRCIDGDTFVLRDIVRGEFTECIVRVWGIDAPEKYQFWGNEAKYALETLILYQRVKVLKVGTDRYKRVVGLVIYHERDIGKIMIATGNAWWYDKYAPKRRDYYSAQLSASQAPIGLWAVDEGPLAPWDWRKENQYE